MKTDNFNGVCWVMILLLPLQVYAQSALTDTNRLGDYSYLIYGRTKTHGTVQATGLLVKANKSFYLVTACHVINGWYYESFEKDGSYPDTLFLRLYSKINGRPVFLPLDIRKIKNVKTGDDWPDVYFYPLSIPDSCRAYDLTTAVMTINTNEALPKTVRIYGYRIMADTDTISFDKLQVVKGNGIIINKDDYACDPYTYKFHYNENELGPGDSGAPVYFVYTEPNGQSRIVFGGLVVGGAAGLHQALAIKPEIIRNILASIINQL